jgi:hypothetical protein
MAITTFNQLKNLKPERLILVKPSFFASVDTRSLYTHTIGVPPTPGAPSSGLSGALVTKSGSVGALKFTNAEAGESVYLLSVYLAAIRSSTLLLYDRLWENSGISVTSTSAQTINSVALDRPDANGADVEAWWHVYSAMGSGTPTVTLSYTNQDGVSGRTATSGVLPSVLAANRTGSFSLESGDTGVRSVQTWTSSASFTSGVIGLVLRRKIAMCTVHAGKQKAVDEFLLGIPKIYDQTVVEVIPMAVVVTTASNHNMASFFFASA